MNLGVHVARTKTSLIALLGSALIVALSPAVARCEDAHLPAVVAHRGLLLDAPENTLANFAACLELRLGFEFDVRRCADGTLVCIHDDTIDRTTSGKGQVGAWKLDQLQRLDAGGWFSAAYAGEKVPTIDAVLALIAAHKVPGLYTVDLKAADPEVERDVVRLAVRHGVLDRLLFIGRAIDQAEVRGRLRAAAPECHVAAVANNRGELARAIGAADADWVYLRFVPQPADGKAIRAAGKKSFIAGATVAGRESENWIQAANSRIDGILTDHALECRRELRGKR